MPLLACPAVLFDVQFRTELRRMIRAATQKTGSPSARYHILPKLSWDPDLPQLTPIPSDLLL